MACSRLAALWVVSACAASPDAPATNAGELTELRGEFHVLSEQNESGETLTAYGLIDEQSEWVLLSVEGLDLPPSGTRVELRGRWIDEDTFEADAIELLSRFKGLLTDPPERPAHVHHNVMIMVSRDVASTAAEREMFRAILQRTMDEVTAFYGRVTHGVDTFELGLGTTPGYTNEPGIYFSERDVIGAGSCGLGGRAPMRTMSEDFVGQPHPNKTETQLQAELDAYEHIIAIVPVECLGNYGWGRPSSVNQDGELEFGDLVGISETLIRDESFAARAVAHELGHNLLGSFHSSAYECEDYYQPYLQGCEGLGAYRNYNDVMGGGYVDTWFMTSAMRRMGWLPPDRVETPVDAGSRQYELAPMDSGQLDGTQAIRIPVHGEDYTTFFYLEYRRPSAHPYSGVKVGNTRQPTVLLTYADDVTGRHARLELDTGDRLGLALGRAYTIGSGEHQVGVTVHSMGQTARVEVTTQEAPGRDPLCADGVSHPNETQTEAWHAGGREGPPECGCPGSEGGVCLVHLNAGIEDAPASRIRIGYSGLVPENLPAGVPTEFPDDGIYSYFEGFWIGLDNRFGNTQWKRIELQSDANTVEHVFFSRLPEGHYHASLFVKWRDDTSASHTLVLQRLRISIGEPDPHFVRTERDPRTEDGDPSVDLPYEEVIGQAFTLQTLEALLVATQIRNEVPATGITLFAPWDSAFQAAPSYWARMRYGYWHGHLRDFLLGHIHGVGLPNSGLTDGRELTMMNGQTRVVSRAPDGPPELDGVSVIGSLLTTNANMHLTQDVLAPAWADHTIVEVLEDDERFTSLTAMLALPAMVDYRDALSDVESGLTLFAPTDDAMSDVMNVCSGAGACEAAVEPVRLILAGQMGEGVQSQYDRRETALTTQRDTRLDWDPQTDTVRCTPDGGGDPQVTTVESEELYATNGIVQPVNALLCRP